MYKKNYTQKMIKSKEVKLHNDINTCINTMLKSGERSRLKCRMIGAISIKNYCYIKIKKPEFE
jgi:hypothetical protein